MSELSSYNLRSDQEIFLEAYLQSGDVEEGARACGRKTGTCRQWMRDTKIQQVISRELKQRLDNGAIGALSVITELATSSSDPKIQLQAARDLLDRAGYKPEHLHTSADKRMEGANMQEMVDRIKELQGELGLSTGPTIDGQAREVDPTAPPPPPTPDDDPNLPNQQPPQLEQRSEPPKTPGEDPTQDVDAVDFRVTGDPEPVDPSDISIEDLF